MLSQLIKEKLGVPRKIYVILRENSLLFSSRMAQARDKGTEKTYAKDRPVLLWAGTHFQCTCSLLLTAHRLCHLCRHGEVQACVA